MARVGTGVGAGGWGRGLGRWFLGGVRVSCGRSTGARLGLGARPGVQCDEAWLDQGGAWGKGCWHSLNMSIHMKGLSANIVEKENSSASKSTTKRQTDVYRMCRRCQ